SLSYFIMTPQPPRSTLFPYTTLFRSPGGGPAVPCGVFRGQRSHLQAVADRVVRCIEGLCQAVPEDAGGDDGAGRRLHARGKGLQDRKSTRLNSSHDQISYAVFCLKKK